MLAGVISPLPERSEMNGSSDRREFFKQAAGAAVLGLVSAGTLRPLAGDEKKNDETKVRQQKDPNVDAQASLPIVDTHEHLWDLTKFNLPWTKGNEKLARSFVTKDYLEA